MDWNKLVLIGGQSVVVIVLGVLVATGHDGTVTDALLAVAGSVTGLGLYQTVVKK